ncbi:MAG: 5'-methylthioadenosine/S-adenosylhomocysteine nucleosidase, partial [Bacteroidaceae bacterium]|nr:5'-methylthioadenosine/S-adenosylhomocysteine nucleosidase [Bacteroidaceae bacterium]
MKIGILTAMESEHNQIAALLTDKNTVNDQFTYVVGKLDDKEIILRQCGIGKVNAAVGTAELIRTFHPDYVISTGVAGGIDSCLNVMDVVVSTKTVHHDFYIGMGCEYGQVQGMPTYFEADQRLVDAALALNNPTIHTGLICTGDQFISTQDEIDNIKHN